MVLRSYHSGSANSQGMALISFWVEDAHLQNANYDAMDAMASGRRSKDDGSITTIPMPLPTPTTPATVAVATCGALASSMKCFGLSNNYTNCSCIYLGKAKQASDCRSMCERGASSNNTITKGSSTLGMSTASSFCCQFREPHTGPAAYHGDCLRVAAQALQPANADKAAAVCTAASHPTPAPSPSPAPPPEPFQKATAEFVLVSS